MISANMGAKSNNDPFNVPSVDHIDGQNKGCANPNIHVPQGGVTLSDTNPIPNASQSSDVENLAKLYLCLSTKHFATESVLQPIIAGRTKIFEKCTNGFISETNNDNNFSYDQKEEILVIFENNFHSINEAHNSKYGFLRTAHTRKEHYRKKWNYLAREQVNFEVREHESK